MRTKPFPALAAHPDHVAEIASVPYDVVSTEEARAIAAANPNSFLHVLRAEIDFPPDTDPYSGQIYDKALENFMRLQNEGLLLREEKDCLYLYRQVMGDHVQTGIALACHIDDYAENIIRKHEKTRPVKEDDRTRLIDTLGANPGPVFLTYKDVPRINALVDEVTSNEDPAFSFVDDAGVEHTIWRVTERTDEFTMAFEKVPLAYVADGHHRSASAYRVGIERRAANPNHNGSENYNWFLAVLFPATQLQILPYNRVVKDLNGLSTKDFLDRVRERFTVSGNSEKTPDSPGQACMYLDGTWYLLRWPEVDSPNPIASLDASVLQDRLFSPILGIGDQRIDDRIGFIGGIRGTGELEKRVDGGGWAVAFSMYPVTVDQLTAIADSGEIMPPKCTWFEPKLRSGLFVYTLD